MKINSVKFLKSAAGISDFPNYRYPEFAFFGRSNTGKSSLINMITGRKSLVKTGANPGVTKLINFFLINEKISIADMPGFGYAKIAKSTRNKFLPLIKDYIKNRINLKTAFLLVDIRRIPAELEKDIIIELTEHNKPIAILATKCDKLSRNQRINNAKRIADEFMIGIDSIFFTSSKTGEGKEEIFKLIAEFTK